MWAKIERVSVIFFVCTLSLVWRYNYVEVEGIIMSRGKSNGSNGMDIKCFKNYSDNEGKTNNMQRSRADIRSGTGNYTFYDDNSLLKDSIHTLLISVLVVSIILAACWLCLCCVGFFYMRVVMAYDGNRL